MTTGSPLFQSEVPTEILRARHAQHPDELFFINAFGSGVPLPVVEQIACLVDGTLNVIPDNAEYLLQVRVRPVRELPWAAQLTSSTVGRHLAEGADGLLQRLRLHQGAAAARGSPRTAARRCLSAFALLRGRRWRVQDVVWSELYTSVPNIFGPVTTSAVPVYDKSGAEWRLLGVRTRSAAACEPARPRPSLLRPHRPPR